MICCIETFIIISIIKYLVDPGPEQRNVYVNAWQTIKTTDTPSHLKLLFSMCSFILIQLYSIDTYLTRNIILTMFIVGNLTTRLNIEVNEVDKEYLFLYNLYHFYGHYAYFNGLPPSPWQVSFPFSPPAQIKL